MNVSRAVVPSIGRTVRSKLTSPHPSAAFGMSGVPKSRAPLMSAAFTKELDGEETPTCSRMNSRVSPATPDAMAVACDVPLSVM